MKYLILILTLLFTFNVKAETYVCAYTYNGQIMQNILYRDGDVFIHDYEMTFDTSQRGTDTYQINDNTDGEWIVLSRIFFETEVLFSTAIKAINKETLEYIQYYYVNFLNPESINVYEGTCERLP